MVTALLRIEFGQQQRKFHVLKGGEYRDQVERLENVADVRVAPVGRLFVIKAENVLAKHQQLAFGRAVDGGNHVQARGHGSGRDAYGIEVRQVEQMGARCVSDQNVGATEVREARLRWEVLNPCLVGDSVEREGARARVRHGPAYGEDDGTVVEQRPVRSGPDVARLE